MRKKLLPLSTLLILYFAGCSQAQQTSQGDTMLTAAPDGTGNSADTTLIAQPDDVAEAVAPQSLPDISGKHAFTLQWLGWNRPGSVEITSTGNNTYTVKGGQKIKNEYVKIDGKLTMLSPNELEFDGTIITRTDINNQGKECVKKGKQIFLSTKNRKYWRLQNMDNCEGDRVLDYVDIYF